jgi:hypothetical protein
MRAGLLVTDRLVRERDTGTRAVVTVGGQVSRETSLVTLIVQQIRKMFVALQRARNPM